MKIPNFIRRIKIGKVGRFLEDHDKDFLLYSKSRKTSNFYTYSKNGRSFHVHRPYEDSKCTIGVSFWDQNLPGYKQSVSFDLYPVSGRPDIFELCYASSDWLWALCYLPSWRLFDRIVSESIVNMKKLEESLPFKTDDTLDINDFLDRAKNWTREV